MVKTQTDETLLEKFRKQAERDWEVQEDQRDRADEDMRFVTVPGAQWEGFLEDLYGEGSKKTRPRFEYDRLASAVNRFHAEWTTNRAAIRFRPDDGKSDEREAELLEGLLRRDMRRNIGQFAIDNAVIEAARCGMGAFRIITDWVDEEERDQLIYFDPIYCAHNTVIWDCNAKRMDKSDAKHCTLIHEMSKEAFEEKYPDADCTSVAHDDRRTLEWFRKDSVFIAERYWIEEKKEEARIYINPVSLREETYWLEDIDLVIDEMEAMGFQLVEELKIRRRRIFKRVFSGAEFLEPRKEISGKHIPVIPVYGFWAYVDGMERYWGIPTALKDAQRLFNLQISRMAEMSATSPRRTPIFSPEQMDDPDGIIQALWHKAQYEDLPYLLANPAIDPKTGNLIANGPLAYLEPPALDQTSTALLEITGGYLQQETGGAPQDVLDPDSSGKAILAQAQRIDMNTQPIMDNVKTSLQRAGEVYRWIAADVYSAPRTVTALGLDGDEYEARLFDVVIDRQTGRPQNIHDITRGRFEVVVDTGPSYQSRRQATVDSLSELLQVVGEDSPYFGPMMAMLIDNIDGSGLDKLKQFNNRIMLQLGLREPEDEQEAAMVEQMRQPQPPGPEEELLRATAQKELAEAQESQSRSQRNMIEAEIKTLEFQKDLMEAQGQELDASQMRVLTDIVTSVAEGKFPRESGVQLITGFGISEQEANALLNRAGTVAFRSAPPPRQRPLLQ